MQMYNKLILTVEMCHLKLIAIIRIYIYIYICTNMYICMTFIVTNMFYIMLKYENGTMVEDY